eukprot:1148648-Pelagomonas_calceolata.AAC.7
MSVKQSKDLSPSKFACWLTCPTTPGCCAVALLGLLLAVGIACFVPDTAKKTVCVVGSGLQECLWRGYLSRINSLGGISEQHQMKYANAGGSLQGGPEECAAPTEHNLWNGRQHTGSYHRQACT